MRLLLILALAALCIVAVSASEQTERLKEVERAGIADKIARFNHFREQRRNQLRAKREATPEPEVTPETHPQYFYGKIPKLSYVFRREREEEAKHGKN